MEEPVPDVPEHLELEQLKQENAALKAQLEQKKKAQNLRQRIAQKVGNLLWKATAGKSLSSAIAKILAKINQRTWPDTEELSDAIAAVIQRTTKLTWWRLIVMIAPVLFSAITIPLLLQQNRLITHQNMLAESTRRATLIAELTEIMNKIDEELDEHDKKGQKGKHTLSPRLIGRIVGLSRSLKPYKYLNNEGELTELLSPERGQLLINLVNSDIDTTSLIDIYKKADFNYADLKEVVLDSTHFLKKAYLEDANLQGADLRRANLQGANLRRANLQGADLRRANLQGAYLRRANLQGAYLRRANLQGAYLRRANLQGANLRSANLQGAYLEDANLQGADLWDANLQGAYLRRANLQGANLRSANLQGTYLEDANLQGADLRRANLQGANLRSANLQGANLRRANLQGANLRSANLKEVKVRSKTWFKDLQKLSKPPEGLEALMEKYKVDISNVYQDCDYCDKYYKIIEK